MKFFAAILMALGIVGAAHSATVYDTKTEFATAAGPSLVVEDWRSYAPETLLDGQTVRGVTYGSSADPLLVVGAPHGPDWRLGYSAGEGRYASFSWETISFLFSSPISSFGIALSQGNQSGASNYTGLTVWEVIVSESQGTYFPSASYVNLDFTGESYLGLTDLSAGTLVTVRRLSSTAPISWDIRDISWVPETQIPVPATLALLGLGLASLGAARRKQA
jgi:hypothetical protein